MRSAASLDTAKRVLRIESEAIAGLIERLDARFEQAVERLYMCKGRVVVTGVGKSGLIGRKVAATFASTGTPALFLHAADALHGDLGMLQGDDVLRGNFFQRRDRGTGRTARICEASRRWTDHAYGPAVQLSPLRVTSCSISP